MIIGTIITINGIIIGSIIPLDSTDLLYIPRYENPVCLGAKCKMREW